MKNSNPAPKKPHIFNKTNLINIVLLILFAVILGISTMSDKALSIEAAAGNFLISTLLLFILYKDLLRYKPLIYKNHKMILLIGVLLSSNFLKKMRVLIPPFRCSGSDRSEDPCPPGSGGP